MRRKSDSWNLSVRMSRAASAARVLRSGSISRDNIAASELADSTALRVSLGPIMPLRRRTVHRRFAGHQIAGPKRVRSPSEIPAHMVKCSGHDNRYYQAISGLRDRAIPQDRGGKMNRGNRRAA